MLSGHFIALREPVLKKFVYIFTFLVNTTLIIKKKSHHNRKQICIVYTKKFRFSLLLLPLINCKNHFDLRLICLKAQYKNH